MNSLSASALLSSSSQACAYAANSSGGRGETTSSSSDTYTSCIDDDDESDDISRAAEELKAQIAEDISEPIIEVANNGFLIGLEFFCDACQAHVEKKTWAGGKVYGLVRPALQESISTVGQKALNASARKSCYACDNLIDRSIHLKYPTSKKCKIGAR